VCEAKAAAEAVGGDKPGEDLDLAIQREIANPAQVRIWLRELRGLRRRYVDLEARFADQEGSLRHVRAANAALDAECGRLRHRVDEARIFKLEEALVSIRDRARGALDMVWGRNSFEGGDGVGKLDAELRVREASALIRDLADLIQNACPDASWWTGELAGRVDAWLALVTEDAPQPPDES
jgi:hypothetical protein